MSQYDRLQVYRHQPRIQLLIFSVYTNLYIYISLLFVSDLLFLLLARSITFWSIRFSSLFFVLLFKKRVSIWFAVCGNVITTTIYCCYVFILDFYNGYFIRSTNLLLHLEFVIECTSLVVRSWLSLTLSVREKWNWITNGSFFPLWVMCLIVDSNGRRKKNIRIDRIISLN